MSYELLDIGLHYTKEGVVKVKSLPLYQRADSAIDFQGKFDMIVTHGQELYTMVDQKFSPMLLNVFFLYDQQKDKITSFIKVVTQQRADIVEYVTKTYSSV